MKTTFEREKRIKELDKRIKDVMPDAVNDIFLTPFVNGGIDGWYWISFNGFSRSKHFHLFDDKCFENALADVLEKMTEVTNDIQ